MPSRAPAAGSLLGHDVLEQMAAGWLDDRTGTALRHVWVQIDLLVAGGTREGGGARRPHPLSVILDG